MTPRLSRIAAAFASTLAVAVSGCPTESGGQGGGGSATTTSEGGSGTGGTTTTETTTSTTSTGPILCNEPVTMPVIKNGQCDLLQQDCPPGQTCEPTSTGTSTLCVKGGGLKGPGKPCDTQAGDSECQAHLFCIGPPNGVGVCTRPCCPSNDEPCGGGDCNAEVNFPGGLTVLMCAYLEQCTLFDASSCKNGQQCQFLYPAQGLAVCTFPGQKTEPEGGPCEFINDCAAMSVCFGGTCHFNCEIGGGGTPGEGGCPAGESCQDVYPDAAGGIGVCQ